MEAKYFSGHHIRRNAPNTCDSCRLWIQIRAAHGARRLVRADEPMLTPLSTTALAVLAGLLLKIAEHRGAGLRNGLIC